MSGTAQCPACGSKHADFRPGVRSHFADAPGQPGVHLLDAKLYPYRCALCGHEFTVTVPYDRPACTAPPGPPPVSAGCDCAT